MTSTTQDFSGATSTSNQLATGFVVAGLRAGRVPLLLAGSEERLVWMLIPVECGYVQLPRVRVLNRRRAPPGTAKALGGGGVVGSVGGDETGADENAREDKDAGDAEGREIKVVDVRTVSRKESGGDEDRQIGSVLVLP